MNPIMENIRNKFLAEVIDIIALTTNKVFNKRKTILHAVIYQIAKIASGKTSS